VFVVVKIPPLFLVEFVEFRKSKKLEHQTEATNLAYIQRIIKHITLIQKKKSFLFSTFFTLMPNQQRPNAKTELKHSESKTKPIKFKQNPSNSLFQR